MEEIVYLSIRLGCTAYLLYKVWEQKKRIGKICDLLYTPRKKTETEKDHRRNPESAAAIGMFPAGLLPRIQPVGNAAGEGARIALLNEEERKEMDRTVKNMDFVELAASPEFQDCFVDGLCFP